MNRYDATEAADELGHPADCPSRKHAGIEVQGVYDGVLVWFCQVCDAMWPAWPVGHRRHKQATDLIAKWRAQDQRAKGGVW